MKITIEASDDAFRTIVCVLEHALHKGRRQLATNRDLDLVIARGIVEDVEVVLNQIQGAFPK